MTDRIPRSPGASPMPQEIGPAAEQSCAPMTAALVFAAPQKYRVVYVSLDVKGEKHVDTITLETMLSVNGWISSQAFSVFAAGGISDVITVRRIKSRSRKSK